MVKLSLMAAFCGVTLLLATTACTRKSAEPLPAPTQDPAEFMSKTSERTEAAAGMIWVSRPDGAESCAKGTGQTLEAGAAELRKAKVRVMQSRKGSDGKMHMQMCGAATGSTNSYLIAKEDLSHALKKGFAQEK